MGLTMRTSLCGRCQRACPQGASFVPPRLGTWTLAQGGGQAPFHLLNGDGVLAVPCNKTPLRELAGEGFQPGSVARGSVIRAA